ncbi:hypothetical protein Vadar_031962 [Vaccinium darrowii]|uniref:Uncharacterized protein n=1 Tax=Vaccinium darrowii TaxID=229202 RepID=A0ACB7YIP0_9ERIC|nr:hypothetical protein Vadar_031962 [Vaccinium darrowii]
MCESKTQPCGCPPRVRHPPNGGADTTRPIQMRIQPPLPRMQKCRDELMKRWRANVGRLGIWSLVLAVAGPVSLHLLDMFLFRSAKRTLIHEEATSYGPWFMDAVYIHMSVMTSLCCCLGLAKMDRKPDAARLLGFWLGYIVLNVTWDGIVFEFEAFKVGLLASVMKTWFAAAIAWMLIDLNETASTYVGYIASWNFLVVMMSLKIWKESGYK